MSESHIQPLLAKPRTSYRALFLQTVFTFVGLGVVLFGAHDLFVKVETYSLASARKLPLTETTGVATTSPSFRLSAPALRPSEITLPAIGVKASIVEVGKDATGAMATPKKFNEVAWYGLGAKPGEAGNAVFAGHVNNALTQSGVFQHLVLLATGDEVLVSDGAGDTLTFIVTHLEDYTEDEAPREEIFSILGPSGIVLITCAGEWNQRAHSYDKRLVVYARLKG